MWCRIEHKKCVCSGCHSVVQAEEQAESKSSNTKVHSQNNKHGYRQTEATQGNMNMDQQGQTEQRQTKYTHESNITG